MTRKPPSVAAISLAALVLAYALAAGALALRRHANLNSQALDMGYADQVTWNVTQGRPFRFTVFRGPIGADIGGPLAFGPLGDRDSLLAFHTEFLFLPLAALYLIWPGPEALIVLLTGVLALGAVPAYLLAMRALGSRVAALVLAAAYLLAPSIQAANLADFHLVSMASTPLLFALYFMESRRYALFAVAMVTAALMKEEVGLLVAMMGFYLVRRGERPLGAVVAGGAVAWVALCVLVVIPRHNGGAPSLFVRRYETAAHHVRALPGEWLAGQPTWPVPDFTATYLRGMVTGTAFLAVLSPLRLALSAPALAINGLSESGWQHGGGAHYSAEAVPGILFAAIGALRRVSDAVGRRWERQRHRSALLLSLVVLAAALWQAREEGILPPARRFSWPKVEGRAAALRPLLARIPPDASLSVQSNLFPHLSRRGRIYVFPAIEDASHVLVDVAGTSDPLGPDDLAGAVTALLSDPRFHLLDGTDGALLFRRQENPPREPTVSDAAPLRQLPEAFYRFAAPHGEHEIVTVGAIFEDLFEVVGYHASAVPGVSFGVRRAVPTVYVRALRPPDRDYRFTLFRVRGAALASTQDNGNSAQLWHPTSGWAVREVVRLRYPPVVYADGERLGVGVRAHGDPSLVSLLPSHSRLAVVAGHIPVLGALP